MRRPSPSGLKQTWGWPGRAPRPPTSRVASRVRRRHPLVSSSRRAVCPRWSRRERRAQSRTTRRGLSWFHLQRNSFARSVPGIRAFGSGRKRGAGGHEAHTGGDQSNASPARWRDFFVKTEVANQSDEHVSERGGWQHIGEVRPRQRGHVTGEEGEQEKDSQCHPRVKDGQQQTGKVVEGKAAEIFHAASQQGITRSAEYGDSRQD